MLAFQIPASRGNWIPVTTVTTAQLTSHIEGKQYRLLLLPLHCHLSLFEVMTLSLSGLTLSNFYLFYDRMVTKPRLCFALWLAHDDHKQNMG